MINFPILALFRSFWGLKERKTSLKCILHMTWVSKWVKYCLIWEIQKYFIYTWSDCTLIGSKNSLEFCTIAQNWGQKCMVLTVLTKLNSLASLGLRPRLSNNIFLLQFQVWCERVPQVWVPPRLPEWVKCLALVLLRNKAQPQLPCSFPSLRDENGEFFSPRLR